MNEQGTPFRAPETEPVNHDNEQLVVDSQETNGQVDTPLDQSANVEQPVGANFEPRQETVAADQAEVTVIPNTNPENASVPTVEQPYSTIETPVVSQDGLSSVELTTPPQDEEQVESTTSNPTTPPAIEVTDNTTAQTEATVELPVEPTSDITPVASTGQESVHEQTPVQPQGPLARMREFGRHLLGKN